ncbi:ATP-binding cassette domain-containing protein [Candidatus Marinimicrobia bacterium MT.SAG.2]|nr:ATP-binding cassette domain-containing protein [Candidatus Marinimicrobia bacterium MT.SAG.2]
MLRLKNVSKKFEELQAVSSVDLNLWERETIVLVGPSGCGKSTLIRLAIGIITPDEGEIYFKGELVTPENLMEIRRKIGYVIQEGGLFPHLTAIQNIRLVAEYLDWNPDKINTRIKDLTDLTHFPVDALERFPLQLSGGQRQRVSLMRALMLDPEVLLLDEPLGALDPMIRADLQEELKGIFKSLGKAVLLVTHDINEAGFFADEILLMKDGKVLQQGSIRELLDDPADDFVKKFINAQRNRI